MEQQRNEKHQKDVGLEMDLRTQFRSGRGNIPGTSQKDNEVNDSGQLGRTTVKDFTLVVPLVVLRP